MEAPALESASRTGRVQSGAESMSCSYITLHDKYDVELTLL